MKLKKKKTDILKNFNEFILVNFSNVLKKERNKWNL